MGEQEIWNTGGPTLKLTDVQKRSYFTVLISLSCMALSILRGCCGVRAMRPTVFGLLWSFTTLAAGYDAYFAWQHQNGFEIWELNPFICWLASFGGLEAVIVFKIVTTIFAAGLAVLCRRRRHWLETPLTLTVSGIFFVLSIYYVIALKAPDPASPSEASLASIESKKPEVVYALSVRRSPWRHRAFE